MDLVSPGNDHGDRWGDPELGYMAAVWGVGDLHRIPAYGDRVRARVRTRLDDERAWIDYQVDQRSAAWSVEDGCLDPSEVDAHLMADLEQYARSCGDRTPTLEELLPARDHSGRGDKLACHDPAGFPEYLLSCSKGLVYPVTDPSVYVNSRDHDMSPCPALAPSPLDYMTWSDAFRPDEAGVLGWALARQQVRYDPLGRGAGRVGPAGFVTAREVQAILHLSREGCRLLLLRLEERGFAQRQTEEGFRLLFEEMYFDGDLHSDRHASQLVAHHGVEIEQRDQRRQAADMYERLPIPVKGSKRFGRLASDNMLALIELEEAGFRPQMP